MRRNFLRSKKIPRHRSLSLDATIDSEPEADPHGNEWDDLDAEDGDDPLMVSEYGNKIIDYMQNTKVSVNHLLHSQSAHTSPSVQHPPQSQLHVQSKELAWSM